MKVAYLDCPTGVSGNMIMAALLDAGLPLSYLENELSKLKLKGYKLKLENVTKKGFRAKHLAVIVSDNKTSRTISDIYRIIDKSKLKASVKHLSKKIFERLFEAESKVHGGKKHHLHEVGAVDAIIDIVGAAIGFDKLGIAEVYCSPLPYGHGQIKSAHGLLPNPAPATLKLLAGVPVYKKDIKAELVTPTGAAIITTMAKSFKEMPKFELKKTGLGAGTYELPEANIMRLFIGEAAVNYSEDLVLSIEANIDNMNPELYDHAIATLMKAGALDAYISQIKMKKNRPGIMLTALANVKDKDNILDKIFSETTTLGVRTYLVKREKLDRYQKQVQTKYGKVLVKVGKVGDAIKNISPEYEDCARISRIKKVPLKLVYDEAKMQAVKEVL
jgi:hypothetical protein